MLPKIEYSIHTIQIPSTKKKLNFRPFLVKEEKLLLMAKESADDNDILRAIRQIVNNCCVDEKFNINDMSITDLAFIFIRLRSISVNNKIKQTYLDHDDDKTYTVEIDLDKVEIHQEKVVPNIIKISNTMGLVLRYPPAQIFGQEPEAGDVIGTEVIANCIEKIYQGEEIFLPNDYSKKDLIDFIEHLPIHALEAINEFIDNTPELRYETSYTNSLGQEKKIVLKTLADFFTFR
jgi:hypothetical protein